jgi:hypothetical protein
MALVTSDPKYYHSGVVNYSKFKYSLTELPDIRIIFDTIDKITQTTLIANADINKIDTNVKQRYIDILRVNYSVESSGVQIKKFSDLKSGNIVGVIPLEDIEITLIDKKITLPKCSLFIPQNVSFMYRGSPKYCIVFTQ